MMHGEKMQHDEMDLFHRHYTNQHKQRISTSHLLVISFMILVLLAWNVCLTVQQWHLANDLSILRDKHKRLDTLCSFEVIKDGAESDNLLKSADDILIHSRDAGRTTRRIDNVENNHKDAISEHLIIEQGSQTSHIESSLLDSNIRTKRSASGLDDKAAIIESGDGDGKKSERKRKSRKNKKVSGAHFVAYVDEDRVQREKAEGLPSSVGNFTDHGLNPKGRIYNFWKPEQWNNNRLFKYSTATGKVKVKSSGLYLIYGQMMFHGPSARKSYGIHVNDETVPFIESLSFDNIRGTRTRRSADPYNPDPYAVSQPAGEAEMIPMRHRRSGYASYSQCNTLAVRYLQKNDEVFLKSLEFARSVIPRGYLTFWGMAKL